MISCWEFKTETEFANSKPIGDSQIGHTYHIAFFTKDDEGNPVFDEHFEAILGDPETYLKNLTGAGLYGCILKKTEASGKWFEEYLKRALNHVKMSKMKSYAESIANT
jgi:hypothetical protein